MRVLVLFAHPSHDGFDGAILARAVAALTAAGHEVDVFDIYAEGFDPLLSAEEWVVNAEAPANRATVAPEVARLERAEALVLLFPTWWSGVPAALKGVLDRVFLPGVAFELGASRAPLLTHLRDFCVITTGGASRLVTLYLGDPLRWLMRAVRVACAPQARAHFLRMYDMDTAGEAARARFLDRVAERLARLK
jgi:NAD(P)H dehydrogenase (quinone)